MIRLGYCCINLSRPDLSVNRGMIKKTYQSKGLKYAGELAELNILDMIEIIKWNHQYGIEIYRMSSSIFPWMSEYQFSDLPNFKIIENLLKEAGQLALQYGQRLSFHPGQFNILTSDKKNVVQNTVKELNQHAEIMDLMGLPQTHNAAINIHVGGVYGEKENAISRFINNFKLLSPSTQSRLVLENDDKPNQYGVMDLYRIWTEIGTPITFDYLHHFCYKDTITEEAAIHLAAQTWNPNIRQLCHYSSAKKLHEDASCVIRAHADYVYEAIQTYGLELDIEIEAKAKELALLKYQQEYIKK